MPRPLRTAIYLLSVLTALAPGVFAADTPSPATVPITTPRPNTAVIAAPQQLSDGIPQRQLDQTAIRHQNYSEQAKKGGIDVLFVGDSIVQGWPDTGKVAWDGHYAGAPFKVAAFGVGYDRTQHVLWRLQNGEGQSFSPKVVELLIGTNNLGPNTPDETVAGIKAVVAELRKNFPGAKILLLGILPRGLPGDPKREDVIYVNSYLAQLADLDHVFYLDLAPKLLDGNGAMLPGVFKSDNLHPAAAGYEIWAEATQTPLAQLLKLAGP